MSPKPVILTERRKNLIRGFRMLTAENIGTEEWVTKLSEFLKTEDSKIFPGRVRFWIDNHPWITAPAPETETTHTDEPLGASASVPLSEDDINEKIDRKYVGRDSTAGLDFGSSARALRREPPKEDHLDPEEQAKLMAYRLFWGVVPKEATKYDLESFVKTQKGRRLSSICKTIQQADSDDDEDEVTEEEKATTNPETSRKATLRSAKALNTKN